MIKILSSYIPAVLVFFIVLIILKILKKLIIKKFKLIKNIDWFFCLFLSFYFAIKFIQLPIKIETFISYATLIIVAYYAVKIIQGLMDYGAEKVIQKRKQEDAGVDYSIIGFVNKILKMIIWVVAVLIVLQNFGYNVSALLAGVGIGGIAIAVALQNVLSDMFAAFSIYFDKPFQVGDFIIIGDDMGVVKNIGIKSTRIRTLQGQELIIPNKELTETRVHNYKRMEKRRIVFNIGVTYDTSTEKLKNISKIIKDIFNNINLAELDRVHFYKFSDFSLDFEIVYYMQDSDYNKYMDVQQEINFAIKQEFEKQKIEMAFPTQTVYVNKSK